MDTILVDDNNVIRFVLKKLLTFHLGSGSHVYSSGDGVEGLGLIFISDGDLIIIDSTLPKYGGLEVIDYVMRNESFLKKHTPLLVLEEDENSVSESPDYRILNKKDKDFVQLFINDVTKVSGIEYDQSSLNQKIIVWLAKNVITLANASDHSFFVFHHSNNLLLRAISYVLGILIQFQVIPFLTFFYLFSGKRDSELNLEQQKSDLKFFRVKVFPAFTGMIASIILIFIQLSLLLTTFIGVQQFSQNNVLAATYTWDGGGSDGTCGGREGDGKNWSCALNWSGDIVPSKFDNVIFNGTSSKDSVIDVNFGGIITSINISDGYDGIITQQRSLQISSSYSQSSGSYDSTNQILDIDTAFIMSGGNFVASSTNIFLGGTFNVTGNTHFQANEGIITFDGTNPILESCKNVIFNQVRFIHISSDLIKQTANSNCNLP